MTNLTLNLSYTVNSNYAYIQKCTFGTINNYVNTLILILLTAAICNFSVILVM